MYADDPQIYRPKTTQSNADGDTLELSGDNDGCLCDPCPLPYPPTPDTSPSPTACLWLMAAMFGAAVPLVFAAGWALRGMM